ncbi:hypothetical protein GIY23_00075 [Allosaccharopolyspora coralli]|uniref:Sulfotransferase family protein n=1 Tax=Allosaccharopolyspora coralli TaxID=2665642 RepID=A0A5Q3Q137_9PSEU|nr:hypothetical protein [Allosaccharopolyspora coralli]QGK68192.1 hypothetical protein GIY23_00075 [Allosaccharopolyspora coralli]
MSAASEPKGPRVYLHVGAPKTGTTFLQGVLWKNLDTLQQRGVCLPGAEPEDHFRAGFDLCGLDQDEDDPRERWAGAWDAMAAEIRESDSDLVVVSDERLAACTVTEVDRAVASLAPAEVHVVYTTRGLTELFPAEWQEHVKDCDTRPFATWLGDITADKDERTEWFWQVHDVADVLRRWSSVVQAERVHVLTLPPPGSPPDLLWERFTSVLGIDPNGFDTDVRANSSLGVEGAEVLRRVNETLPDFPVWHRVLLTREVLAHHVLARRTNKTRITLPADWAPWVRDYTDQLVAHLKTQDFPVVGDLSELLPGNDAFDQPEGLDQAGLLDAATDSIAGLLVHTSGMQDRDSLLIRAQEAERRLREHRQQAPVDRIKRTVVELGGQSTLVNAMLGVWRTTKRLRRKRDRPGHTENP